MLNDAYGRGSVRRVPVVDTRSPYYGGDVKRRDAKVVVHACVRYFSSRWFGR